MTPTSSYDLVIVGAGSAGCVLANRLSADPSGRVLRSDAGVDHDDIRTGVPAGVPRIVADPGISRGCRSGPEPGPNNRRLAWPRGVRFRVDGRPREVWARELVIAGGAIDSPQIPMRSGVGPAGHRRSHGIEVVRDSPGVGRNLHDHGACKASPASSRRSRSTTGSRATGA